jgi:hypothetical protein
VPRHVDVSGLREGQEVLLGIRPRGGASGLRVAHDIRIDQGWEFERTVDVTEPTGPATLALFEIDGTSSTPRFPAMRTSKPVRAIASRPIFPRPAFDRRKANSALPMSMKQRIEETRSGLDMSDQSPFPDRCSGRRADRPIRPFRGLRQGKNAELYAICDVAEDLAERMAVTHDAARFSPTTMRCSPTPSGRRDHRNVRSVSCAHVDQGVGRGQGGALREALGHQRG